MLRWFASLRWQLRAVLIFLLTFAVGAVGSLVDPIVGALLAATVAVVLSVVSERESRAVQARLDGLEKQRDKDADRRQREMMARIFPPK